MADEHARYVWFPPATVQALKARLNDADPESILVVRGQGEHMTLEVVGPEATIIDEAGLGVLNEAHPCPPFCR